MAGGHVVNALGDGDWAVVTVAHRIDGRDVAERHWGWSVPGKWEEKTGLVRLVGNSGSGVRGSLMRTPFAPVGVSVGNIYEAQV